jgi:RHS repeat-associated protein
MDDMIMPHPFTTLKRIAAAASAAAACAAPLLGATTPSVKIAPNAAPLTWQIGTYTYDGSGNITAISGMNDSYLYDAAGRLVQASANTADHANSQTFSYDAFGNLVEIDASIRIGAATYPVGSATILGVDSRTNRLTNTAPCNAPGTPTCVAASARGYDAAGNLRGSLNGDEYDFNALDQIAERRGAGGLRQRYLYDANGERAAILYLPANGAVPSNVDFTLRGSTPQVLRTVRASGTGANATWSWREDYVYRNARLLGSVVTDGSASGKRGHFHPDHLGTPRLITDDRGYKIALHTYWPFGEEAPGSEADTERMKFTGHERDFGDGPERDLDYMHARHYAPVAGRFLSVDPARGTPAAPQTMNRYAYTAGNPVRAVDPSGRTTVVDATEQDAVDWGLQHSVTFRENYMKVQAATNLLWRAHQEMQALTGTRGHTTATLPPIVDRNGVITTTIQDTYVPQHLSLQQRAEIIAHEIAHQIELLQTNLTLKQRYERHDPGVWLNQAAGPNAYESQYALDVERTARNEMNAQGNTPLVPWGRDLLSIYLQETRSFKDLYDDAFKGTPSK